MATDITNSQSWIEKTPEVCGGDACIRQTRVTVWGLVLSRRLGTSDASILKNIGRRSSGVVPARCRLPSMI